MTAIIDQIWSNIYNEAQCYKSETAETPTETVAQPNFKEKEELQPNHHGNIIILGDQTSGKFSLMQTLANRAENKDVSGLVGQSIKYGGLNYRNVVFNDDDSAIRGSWGMWMPDSEPRACRKQLNVALPKISKSKNLANEPGKVKNVVGDIDMAIICVDMSNPVTIKEQLERWVSMLNDFCQWACTTDSLELLAQSVRAKWDLQPDDEFSLSANIGLPICVVGTKTDLFDELERSENFKDEQFSYIQYHLRKECLSLGAGLCYTSSKNGQNADALYQEILYNIGFTEKKSTASVIDRSSINVPLGWDSLKKIELLQESLLNLDIEGEWTSVIPNANIGVRKVGGEDMAGLKGSPGKVGGASAATVATLGELHQNFLTNLQQKLAITNKRENNTNESAESQTNSPLPPGATHSRLGNDFGGTTTGGLSVGSASQAANQSIQKDGAGSDRVLADFFQQLLKKSSTQPSSPGGSTPAGAGGTPQDNTSTPSAKKPSNLNTSPLANMLNKGKK
jgi:dynein light intermediate chain 1